MKQLKSTAEDLRQLFSSAIPVRFIAESLVSFDDDRPAELVRPYMKEKDFDRVGVRCDGIVYGYVLRSDLADGTLDKYVRDFEEDQIVDDTSSIADVVRMLPEQEAVFVRILGEIGGIITRGDLRKAPVWMWLFGLISLLEMQMLRIISEWYPDEDWIPLLSASRVCKAKCELQKRQRLNVARELVDCLQFCDRRDIILKTDDVWPRLHLASKRKARDFFKDVEKLRNDLAHAGDLLSDRWPDIVDLIVQMEQTLEAAEVISCRQDPCP